MLVKPTNLTMKQLALAENSTSVSDLLTVSEAAEYLRISAWTLRHWVSDKKIAFIKIGRCSFQEDPPRRVYPAQSSRKGC